MTWVPIWALPNISLDKPVDSKYFALVPHNDKRVLSLSRQFPEFKKFRFRFRDVHNKRIHPAFIFRKEEVPKKIYSLEAAASFRDILVSSSIPKAWSLNIKHNNRRGRPSLSTYFWVYPWMIDRHYQDAICYTPTSISLHSVSAINAQSSPELYPINLGRDDFDEPLLEVLLERWNERYITSRPSWENTALFRSLNIACQASNYPSNTDSTILDYGKIISLWVSSFETLVHPGSNGRASLKKVLELFEKVPWIDKKCGYKNFTIRLNGKNEKKNLSCWIYKQLHDCKNDFMHGNPLKNSSFNLPKSKRPLIHFAPLLYRMALTSFLDLPTDLEPPSTSDPKKIANYFSDCWALTRPQKDIESALKFSRITIEEQEMIRQKKINKARDRSRKIYLEQKKK